MSVRALYWMRHSYPADADELTFELSPPSRYAAFGQSHLAFASILFPLVLKKRIADESLLTLDETDRDDLQHIEQLLLVDPFSAESARLTDTNAHPWASYC